jgi:hypothetical protein
VLVTWLFSVESFFLIPRFLANIRWHRSLNARVLVYRY